MVRIFAYLARQIRIGAHLYGDIADLISVQIRTDEELVVVAVAGLLLDGVCDGSRCGGNGIRGRMIAFGGYPGGV